MRFATIIALPVLALGAFAEPQPTQMEKRQIGSIIASATSVAGQVTSGAAGVISSASSAVSQGISGGAAAASSASSVVSADVSGGSSVVAGASSGASSAGNAASSAVNGSSSALTSASSSRAAGDPVALFPVSSLWTAAVGAVGVVVGAGAVLV